MKTKFDEVLRQIENDSQEKSRKQESISNLKYLVGGNDAVQKVIIEVAKVMAGIAAENQHRNEIDRKTLARKDDIEKLTKTIEDFLIVSHADNMELAEAVYDLTDTITEGE